MLFSVMGSGNEISRHLLLKVRHCFGGQAASSPIASVLSDQIESIESLCFHGGIIEAAR